MTRPTFLVIGAMKAGTTSLYTYLRAHPDVYMSETKELHFFTSNWDRGWDWYQRQFAEAGQAQAVGEASPNYTRIRENPEVVERIWKHLPDVRLIYIVRHPIERMRSHYHHYYARGLERKSIDRALVDNPVYLDTSRYGFQVEQYLSRFPREQMLIITSEDLMGSRAATVRRVYEYIGVDGAFTSPALEQTFHRTDTKREPGALVLAAKGFGPTRALSRRAPLRLKKHLFRQLSPKTIVPEQTKIPDVLRRQLEAELADDVARLKAYIGNGFDGWGIG